MARKRTASYKRARRATNKARIQQLIASARRLDVDVDRPSKPVVVLFTQRRNQPLFSLTFSGDLRDFDPVTGAVSLDDNGSMEASWKR